MTTTLTVALHSMVLLLAAAEPAYTVPEQPWDPALGNHRARVRVVEPSPAVAVHLPWRRRDHDAAEKAIFVIDPATRERVKNVATIEVSRETGSLIFQASAAGEYDVYFMPFTIQGGAFPTTLYIKPEPTAKMNHAGGNADFPSPGAAGTCRARGLRVWGSVDSH